MTAALLFFGLVSPGCALDDKEAPTKAPCLTVDEITSYKISEKNQVSFTLKSGDTVDIQVESSCPDLGFHNYVKYIPIDGRLCMGDGLITREGFTCPIIAITKRAKMQNR